MSEISCIGLGLMGSALARTLQGAGHGVTVWNRSPEKLRAFRAAAVACADDLAGAVRASPVVLICIDNYAATKAMLEPVAALLAGRVVVQLSTGTPKEAQELQAWVQAQGGTYLDGAILCGPEQIGGPGSEILLAGDAAAEAAAGRLLACLGEAVRYLGPTVGAASALDLAWLTMWYGQFVAAAHAARMCQSEGASLDDFIALFPKDPNLQRHLRVIRDDNFGEFTASLAVWGAALGRVQTQAVDAGISPAIPDFFAGYFKKAVAAGFGEAHVMALFKVV